jgi:excisionase family DNA binding protein
LRLIPPLSQQTPTGGDIGGRFRLTHRIPKKDISMNDIKPIPQLELPPTLQFFSASEVAIILGTSRKLVITWINNGDLPAFRMGPEGRVIRIRRQDLEAFIQKHTAAAQDDAGTNQTAAIAHEPAL